MPFYPMRGEGALRDAVEFILKAQGKWKEAVENYLQDKGAIPGN
jgi:hypothetical protein